MTPTTALQAQLEDMERRKDGAYEERNRVVAALAKCFPSGVARTAIEGWSEDWHGCVYIDLPTGQVSWHFHDSQAHLFAGLPAYTKPWDGHDTPEKYRRVAALSAPAQDAPPIDMLLHCPACGMQHIDAPEPHLLGAVDLTTWHNPAHRSHLCHGCGHIWRPADVPTNGVAAVKTKGKADSPIAARASQPTPAQDAAATVPKWQTVSTPPDERCLCLVLIGDQVHVAQFDPRMASAKWWNAYGMPSRLDQQPTHWMPLPEAPDTPPAPQSAPTAAATVPWSQSDADAWAERHGLNIHGGALFSAFEDAATLYLTRAATPPAPTAAQPLGGDGWSRSRPSAGGRWLWREDRDREAVELTLTQDGSEVAECSDDGEGTPQHYWEMTPTTQQMMPGMWKRLGASAPQSAPTAAQPLYGIVDPDYARAYSIIRCTAWMYGYAVGMHGSFTRDLDLILVPWTDKAVDAEKLLPALADLPRAIEALQEMWDEIDKFGICSTHSMRRYSNALKAVEALAAPAPAPADAAAAVCGALPDLDGVLDTLSTLSTFLLGFRRSAHCRENGMEVEVDGWRDALRELFHLHDEQRVSAPTPPAAQQAPCGGRENCGRFPFCGCGDDALPERDTSKPAEQQGLFRKFEVRRTDGSDQPGGKHHGCEYFVLDTDHDPAAKPALAAYADAIEATHKPLADDMRTRYGLETAPQAVPLTDAESFVRSLLWDAHPECCGRPCIGGEYMGQQEEVCCGQAEMTALNDAQIVASLRERFPEHGIGTTATKEQSNG